MKTDRRRNHFFRQPGLHQLSGLASVWGLFLATGLGLGAAEDAKGIEFFENKIRPLLADHCYECHSQRSKKLKGGLFADSKDGLLKGGDTGPAIVPGNPDASLLIRAVRYTDANVKMPPKDKRLSTQQIADLEAWVKMGAPDPRTGQTQLAGFDKIMAEGRKHWAFQPVQPPPVPAVKERRWVANPIDAFVLARLEAKGMKPALEADRRTLIRRLSVDLTGLPPTPAEVEAFVSDRSKDAYTNLVERLLASPRYGERWARHWLDVARYADSRGYAGVGAERRFPYSYTYRDYVIRAFNEDLPFDRFIKEQIAADHLATGDDKRALAAMGFLTLNRHFLGNPHDVIDDRIDVVTRGLMGVTVQCARCHDHKYDPIPTRDYYSLYGVFASSTEPGEKPLLGIPPDPKLHEEYLAEKKKRTEERDAFREKELKKALIEVRQRTGEYLLAAHDAGKIQDRRAANRLIQSRKLEETVVERWQRHLAEAAKKHDPILAPWLAFIALEEKDFATKARELAARFVANADKEKPLHPGVARLFEGEPPADLKTASERYGKLFQEIQKQWQDLTGKAEKDKTVQPAVLPDAAAEQLRQVLYAQGAPADVPANQQDQLLDGARPRLTQLNAKIADVDATHPGAPARAMAMVDGNVRNTRVFVRGQPGNPGPEVPRQFLEVLSRPAPKPFAKGSGRLELAEAVASRDNPLTARVLVNRVWMHHFGEGFVRTPSDFGTRSDPPTHPELLDWLAWQFMEQGWSVKQLHRLILTSAAYRMSSDADPKRSTEYALRDPNNTLLWRQNRQRLDFEAMRDSLLFVSGQLNPAPAAQPVDLWKEPFTTHRSVYGFIDRQNLPGVFRAFDFANPDASASRRFTTTVPQQALFLMNSPFVVQQAKALLERPPVKDAGSDESRLQAMYQTVLQRDPAKDELKLALAFVQQPETPRPEPEPSVWKYGYGKFDDATKRVARFTPLPHWTGNAWQGGDKLPHSRLGWVLLNANGGHTGDNPDFMAIRRWTAPRDGIVSLEGLLKHGASAGNGVRGRIISSRHGVLAESVAHNGEAALKLERVGVVKGDTLDFVADCREDTNSDSFNWAPVVKYQDATGSSTLASQWNAEKDFAGPPPKPPEPLTPWQKFAQVLLLSNEFMFVD